MVVVVCFCVRVIQLWTDFLVSLGLHCPALQSGVWNSLCVMVQAGFGISSSTSFPFAFLLLLVALIFRAVSLAGFYQIM